MIRNYLVIAWRGLLKNKLFSIINLLGLALSMSVGMLVLIRMSDAFSYDTFHPGSQDVYRIITKIHGQNGNNLISASSPLPLQQAIARNVSSTLIYPSINSVAKDGSREFDCHGAFIQPSFFEIFGFRLRSGNAASLNDPRSLMMSERFAKRFFGDHDPAGQVVAIGNLGSFEVAGVIETPPTKSHIEYDVFIAMGAAGVAELQDWNTFQSGYTYVKLPNETDKAVLIHELEQLEETLNINPAERLEFELQPLASISPSPSDMYNEIGRSPSRGSLMAEMSIVLVILVAACFNYTNLSIARALTRGKEIGIRKLSGATRIQIVIQYVTEAFLISIFSLILANLILAPILQYQPFNDGYEMIPELQMTWTFAGLVAAFTVLTALMAGGLPAWLLSSFRPARVLRNVATEKLMGHLSLRKVLLVFQFSLSLVVLVFLSTFYYQFDFLSTADPGYKSSGILLIPKGRHAEVTSASVGKLAGVEGTGVTSGRFGNSITITASREIRTGDPSVVDLYACDEGWVKMMRLRTVAGEVNLKTPATIVLNEKAVRSIGFQSPEQATGSMIYLNDSVRVTVTAVVQDFYTNGYGNAIQPVVFRADSSMYKLIGIESTRADATLISYVETEWLKQNTEHSFDYTLLDEEMSRDGRQTATVSLLGFLGLITISIASLGLLGLVVYTVEVKRKEISIRKIVGASVRQIALLLSNGFLFLLCVAGAIALPIGYVLSELFLSNFVNQISIGVLQLAGCFGLLLSIGLVTILSQTIGAASENPAQNLRSE